LGANEAVFRARLCSTHPVLHNELHLTPEAQNMPDSLDDFQKTRADLNEEILSCDHLGVKRFFALDHQAYEPGPLGTKTKELLGLVASAVLRCDDCITYHLVRCGEEGWKREEVIDALNVALVVGGSITIPHVRRAFARMREIDALASK
jgi:AhpD family alkylhydroperoxidase